VSRGYAAYVLGVLFLVYVFNFVDRQVLSILVGPIKRDLGVSDTWMGVLGGLAFALFYTLAGIPIARWADTGSRRTVITFSLTLWSAMTALSGLAQGFASLAAARIGVGIGEAGGTPPSHSLLSDYFPPRRRATALALYANGIYVGSGLGFIAGGAIVSHFDWRTAFWVVGLAGLPLAVLVRATVRELPRGASEGPGGVGEPPGFTQTFRALFAQRAFLWLVIGACFQAISGYAILFWAAEFFARVHELERARIGLWLGLAVMLGGCSGVSIGGWLADRLAARDPAWSMRLPAIVSLAGLPFAAGFVLLGDPRLALASFVPFYTISNMYVGPLWSTAQGVARPDTRAMASAILLFLLNLVGLGLGPVLIGVVNDQLAALQGNQAIRTSLLFVALAGGLAAPFFWLSSRHLGGARGAGG
jgi:predicted MFS family arabinose efflux permease